MDPALSKIPIVLITASAFQDTLDQIEKEGFSYIKSHFTKARLLKNYYSSYPIKEKTFQYQRYQKLATYKVKFRHD
jgi:hypothetical protein